MLLFENIQLALNGLRVNKMRALLTMLGIIIGIGSVIAIMTVAGSMTNSITTSMQSMGANNITVSLTQKSDSDYTEGAQTRMFRPTTPRRGGPADGRDVGGFTARRLAGRASHSERRPA